MMNTFIDHFKKSWKFLLILAFIGGLFGAYPYFVARIAAGESWQGVVPELTGDSLHYMTRANAAIHGDVMGNNPYYAAIYNAPSPSFSIADTITGIPYAFSSPFVATVYNAFLWNALFAVLLGGLLLWLGYSRYIIIVSYTIVASSIFIFMLRVTNMQTIFPFFLIFFISFLGIWYKDRLKLTRRNDALFLGLFAGLVGYLHTFLFQVIAASLVFGVAISLALRRTRLARSLASSIVVMVILFIPYLLYFKGITDFPAFAETMNYFNGVKSHFLSPGVYFYGRWLVLLTSWAFLLWLIDARKTVEKTVALQKGTSGPILEDIVLTIITISLGVLGVMVQNVITGVDIHTIGHANYFVHILLPLGLVLLTFPTVRLLRGWSSYAPKVFLLSCLSIVAIKVFMIIPAQFPNPAVYRPDSIRPAGNPQYIMPALLALRSLPGLHVVAAPVSLNAYIPLYTGQRVLFDPNGESFGVGVTESADRLFTSYLGQSLTEEEVGVAYASTMGGAGSELFGRNNLARELCAAIFHSVSCGTLVVARYFSGDGTFDQSLVFDYYQTVVRRHVVKYLHRFNVSDVAIDRRLPTPEFLQAQTPWYTDQYYAIYDITASIQN